MHLIAYIKDERPRISDLLREDTTREPAAEGHSLWEKREPSIRIEDALPISRQEVELIG